MVQPTFLGMKGWDLRLRHYYTPQIKETVTRFCACAASWFLFWRTSFQDWLLVKNSSSIDPETPDKAIISVFKSYLVHLGSFKRHIFYFCASIVEKIRSHWGEVHEAKFVVVSVPTNGSSVACNVVIWLSFTFCLLSSPVNDLPFPDSS